VENKDRVARDEFLGRLKEEWKFMWTERFDDRVRAEGVVVRDYPLLLVDRGCVIFASRDARTPSFPEIVGYWASKGSVYAPEPVDGGWGKFIRTELRKVAHSRANSVVADESRVGLRKQQMKKGGRGWLHK
jgi:hypothetical protein